MQAQKLYKDSFPYICFLFLKNKDRKCGPHKSGLEVICFLLRGFLSGELHVSVSLWAWLVKESSLLLQFFWREQSWKSLMT